MRAWPIISTRTHTYIHASIHPRCSSRFCLTCYLLSPPRPLQQLLLLLARLIALRMLRQVDKDCSGVLEPEEGKVFLRVTGVPEPQIEARWTELLAIADTNGDGKISRCVAYCGSIYRANGHIPLTSRRFEALAAMLGLLCIVSVGQHKC